MNKLVTALAIFVVLAGIGSCSNSDNAKEPTWQSKWQAQWDGLDLESKTTICGAWDVTPSATAIQLEAAAGVPGGLGFGEKMLKQVC